jgi:hypothetical protein
VDDGIVLWISEQIIHSHILKQDNDNKYSKSYQQ